MKFTIYESATGQILRTGSTTGPSIDHKIQSGEAAVIGEEYDGRDYWRPVAGMTLRPVADFTPLLAAVTEGDVRTLSDLPEGAVVSVSRPEGSDLQAVVASDGEMAITFSDHGDYRITITAAFPFKTSEISIHVDPDS